MFKEVTSASISLETQDKLEERKQINYSTIFMVAYMYFIQGFILSLPDTMTLVYPVLPSYTILGIFSAASLPFSFKFITAPFVEKYTSVQYGKRKFWIVISQLLLSLSLMISSFFTEQQYSVTLAFLLFWAVFLTTLQDISLDAMVIKQLKKASLVAMLQALLQTSGFIIGGLILLKLTSNEFGYILGLQNSICETNGIFFGLSVITLLPTLLIHCMYNEKKQEKEQVKIRSLSTFIGYYRVFVDPNSRYFRLGLMFVVMIQGFNLFSSGYDYQLINEGFSRNTYNTIINLSLIPIIFLGCLWFLKLWLYYMLIREIISLAVWLFFPTSIFIVSFILFITQSLDTMRFIVGSTMVNQMPMTGISGLCITMLNSSFNFGALQTFGLWLTGLLGWQMCAMLGIIIQLGIIIKFKALYEYTEEGTTKLYEQIQINIDKQDQIII